MLVITHGTHGLGVQTLLYRRQAFALFLVIMVVLPTTITQARGRSQPLFYTPRHTLACDSPALTERLSSLDAHRTHREIKMGHCRILMADQLWERRRLLGPLAEIEGVSPSSVDAVRLYIPQSQLIPLEPATSPALSFHPMTLLPAFHQPIIPPDLPLVALGGYTFWRAVRFLRRRRRAWLCIRSLVATHQDTLFQRRHHALTPNHYGAIQTDRWDKEKETFCRTVLLPALTQRRLARFWPRWEKRAYRLIDTRTHLSYPKRPPSPTFEPPKDVSPADDQARVSRMEPLDYERYCAHILQQAGWRTYLTPTGSDQGADIIATRNKVKLVVQCKLYSRPVGNKAVQEVFTACKHQRGHLAAVVSNAGYTRHARQLAASTGVYLLHHRQLSTLDESTPQPGQASFL